MKIKIALSMQVAGTVECEVEVDNEGKVIMHPGEIELDPVHQRAEILGDPAQRPEWADDQDIVMAMIRVASTKVVKALYEHHKRKLSEDPTAGALPPITGGGWGAPTGGAKA